MLAEGPRVSDGIGDFTFAQQDTPRRHATADAIAHRNEKRRVVLVQMFTFAEARNIFQRADAI